MIYREMGPNSDGQMIYGRYDDDGLCRLSCVAEYPEFQEWLTQNNKTLSVDGSIVTANTDSKVN